MRLILGVVLSALATAVLASPEANYSPLLSRAVDEDAAKPMYGETCFKTGERVDGMNKICFYKCPSGDAAITISAVELCPLSIEK